MIRIENPIVVAVFIVLLIHGVCVLPFIKTERLRVTRSKIVGLLIAFAYCVYYGTLIPLLIFLWPLSFFWFPEYWGKFTGHISGPYIDEKSPPALVAAFGWFFLVPFPIFVAWTMNL
ncbi:hypothetical protein K227x_22380 [Rubripirellula lacrimiformis]|uniref:Uncharacterized protein n=1 Tax=Rubripirellula lacrimiformis TaxID=1930273 RepID=A0A517N9P6_9BACT|nr:hypothetical protein [Rubripirellula lacrimiformis]QDT03853.1 hypothetical protein K227x_22380 [Rubripirellula lacrimiformis]